MSHNQKPYFQVAKKEEYSSSIQKKQSIKKKQNKKPIQEFEPIIFKNLIKPLRSFASDFNQEILFIIKDKKTGQISQISSNPKSFTLRSLAKIINEAIEKPQPKVFDLSSQKLDIQAAQSLFDKMSDSTSAQTYKSTISLPDSYKFSITQPEKFDNIDEQPHIMQLKNVKSEIDSQSEQKIKFKNYETSKDLIDAHFVSSSPDYTDEFEESFSKVGNVQEVVFQVAQGENFHKNQTNINDQQDKKVSLNQNQNDYDSQFQLNLESSDLKHQIFSEEESDYTEDSELHNNSTIYENHKPNFIYKTKDQTLTFPAEVSDSYEQTPTYFKRRVPEENNDQEWFLACCDWEAAVEQEREEERQERLFKANLQEITARHFSEKVKKTLIFDNEDVMLDQNITIDHVDQYMHSFQDHFNKPIETTNLSQLSTTKNQRLVGQKRKFCGENDFCPTKIERPNFELMDVPCKSCDPMSPGL